MQLMSWGRLAGVAGIFWIVLIILGDTIGIGGEVPDRDASPETFTTYFAENIGARLWIALWIEMAGLGFGLVFVGMIAHGLGANSPFSRVALATGGTAIGLKLVSAVPILTLFLRADDDLDPILARTLVDLGDMAFVLMFLPLGIFALTTCIASLRNQVLPSWAAYFGMVAGGALLVGMPAAIDGPGFLGMIIFMFWVLVVGVTLVISRGEKDLAASSVRTARAN